MAVHKLVLDDFFEAEDVSLFALHCNLENYRLIYNLNSALGISLKRKKEDVSFENGSSFPLFEWKNPKDLNVWNVVANTFKKDVPIAPPPTSPSVKLQWPKETMKGKANNTKGPDLFGPHQHVTKTTRLVPEYKRVNYFLKVTHTPQATNKTKILHSILGIPHIITAYAVDADQLKSKANLIF